MLPNDLYGEIFNYLEDLTTIRNFVRGNKTLSLIGRKEKENKIRQLSIYETVDLNGYQTEKYYMLPNRLRHGLYQRIHEGKNLECECTYNYGKLHGLYRKWNANDTLIEETNYIHGFKQGLSQKWSYKSILIEKVEYVRGKRFDCEIHDGNGNIYYQIKYTGEADYRYLTWYRKKSHLLMLQRKYKNNVLHGTEKHWHFNGQLRKRIKYINGLKQGYSENWTSQGVKIQQIRYVDNIKQGWTYKWNKKGVLTRDYFYLNGRIKYNCKP